VSDLLRESVVLMIQIQEDGWTVTLTNGRDLTVSGFGITRIHRVGDMSADELVGFALGWVAYHKMVRADSPIQVEPYPVFQ
jgi:hypothetical protein